MRAFCRTEVFVMPPVRGLSFPDLRRCYPDETRLFVIDLNYIVQKIDLLEPARRQSGTPFPCRDAAREFELIRLIWRNVGLVWG